MMDRDEPTKGPADKYAYSRNQLRRSPLIAKKRLVLFGCVFLLFLAACLAYVCHKPAKKESSPTIGKSVTNSIHPKTLDELLALSPDQLEKVDIALINLLCAVGLRGSENLDVEECLKTLDAWALNIGWQTKRNFHRFIEQPREYYNSLAYYRIGMMATILVQDMKIQYNPKLEEQVQRNLNTQTLQDLNNFFNNSQDVFLHGLLSGKHYGTCSSMPFLYVAIGRRLGYRVNVAARKYHIYARYEEENGKHLNIEATENQGIAPPFR
ncbi:MAG: hypothetical protein Q7J98_11550 [Kiritimatiellia bacterium]|nr:hypothetical protein [Kiritimatiellia bacterium]